MKKLTFIFLFLSVFTQLTAQKITGLWEVVEVKVGEETMTPVAKWFHLHKDHRYEAGNGWLQNGIGTWTYDKKKKIYTAKETNGLLDPFGGFVVSFEGTQMLWERQEEGMKVVVKLKRITALPKSTADQLQGMWQLSSMEKAEKEQIASFDPNKKFHFFFRWDRIFTQWNAEGKRSTGYWHINGHRPEITLLPHNKEKGAESWRVEIQAEQLVLIGISDSNKGTRLTFDRKNEFPN